ncbi:MAG: energy transducer TonB [Chitinivibrionales bacterium]|nr:energy transducer TonB [Chitinivibrionales bacterium]
MTRHLFSSMRAESTNFSFFADVLLSISFHVLLFILIPLSVRMLWKQKEFLHPPTFQLISVPSTFQPVKKAAVKPKQFQKKPVLPPPQRMAQSRPASQQSQTEEELDDLSDLLGSVQQPVSNISSGKTFPYAWYLRMVMNKVENNWRPPFENAELFVIVSFSIFANGSISNVTVSKSSGSQLLDNLAVRAIQVSAPFGQLPPAYTQEQLEIDYTLRPMKK